HNTSNNANVNLIAYDGNQTSELSVSAADGTSIFGGLRVSAGQSIFFDPIVFSPPAPTSGTVVARFDIERAWTIRQRGSGSGAGLRFQSETGNKTFYITGPNNNEAL